MKKRAVSYVSVLSLFFTIFPAACCHAKGERLALIIVSGSPDATAWRQFCVSPDQVPTPLLASRNDAKMARDVAEYIFEIPPSNILIVGLSRSQAGAGFGEAQFVSPVPTRLAMLKWIKEFASKAVSAEFTYFYVSAHGGSISDPYPERKSGFTQFLISQDAPVFDFEINALLEKIKSPLLYVVDSCFAAGMARELGFGAVKWFKGSQDLIRPFMNQCKKQAGFIPNSTERVQDNIAFLAACRSDQKALEFKVPGYNSVDNHVSLFTYAFYRVMVFQASTTPAQAINRINEEMRSWTSEQRAEAKGNRINSWSLPMPSSIPHGYLQVKDNILLAGMLAGIQKGELFKSTENIEYSVKSVSGFSAELAPVNPDRKKSPTAVTRQLWAMRTSLPQNRRATVISKGRPLSPQDKESIAENGMVVTWFASPTGSLSATVQIQGYEFPAPLPESLPEPQFKEQLYDYVNALNTSHSMADTLAGQVPQGGARLILTTSRGNDYPTYDIGEKFPLEISSPQQGYLLLIGLEPTGEISVLFPNVDTPLVEFKAHEKKEFTINASAPAGATRLIALLYNKPVELPKYLLQKPGKASYSVPSAKAKDFIMQLNIQIQSERSRDLDVDLAEVKALLTAEIWVNVKPIRQL